MEMYIINNVSDITYPDVLISYRYRDPDRNERARRDKSELPAPIIFTIRAGSRWRNENDTAGIRPNNLRRPPSADFRKLWAH